jgi:hypothetical protein
MVSRLQAVDPSFLQCFFYITKLDCGVGRGVSDNRQEPDPASTC